MADDLLIHNNQAQTSPLTGVDVKLQGPTTFWITGGSVNIVHYGAVVQTISDVTARWELGLGKTTVTVVALTAGTTCYCSANAGGGADGPSLA